MVALRLEHKSARENDESARWKSRSCQRKMKGHRKVNIAIGGETSDGK